MTWFLVAAAALLTAWPLTEISYAVEDVVRARHREGETP